MAPIQTCFNCTSPGVCRVYARLEPHISKQRRVIAEIWSCGLHIHLAARELKQRFRGTYARVLINRSAGQEQLAA